MKFSLIKKFLFRVPHLENFIRLLFRPESLAKWTSQEERSCLAKYAAKTEGKIVEIGTFRGSTAAVISKAMPPKSRLFCIDPFIADSMDPDERGSFFISYLNVLLYGDIKKVTFLKKYSNEAIKDWQDEIKMLWIDGSHHYEDVKTDFKDWSPFVPSGGYILFHDSNHADKAGEGKGWPGPTQLCNEIKLGQHGDYRHIDSVDSLNVFLKP
ncbi:MAG: class I SAM-dependent methyltransferase [Candidatus Omnitrophica bacterium]|nr:class I SAM-dependent methyltransferase [Candidatus Omnitrophota bacterium]